MDNTIRRYKYPSCDESTWKKENDLFAKFRGQTLLTSHKHHYTDCCLSLIPKYTSYSSGSEEQILQIAIKVAHFDSLANNLFTTYVWCLFCPF